MVSFGGSPAWKLQNSKLLSRDEVKKVLALAKQNCERDYVFFAVKANIGLRVGEMVELQWSGLRSNELIVTRLKRKAKLPEPMAISKAVADLLWAWRKKTEKHSRGGFIFPGNDGWHVSIREMQKRWKDYLIALKLYRQGRGIHTLRHYAGTEFYSKYRDLRATQVFLGHSSSVITETYAHVVDMKEKVDGMNPTL